MVENRDENESTAPATLMGADQVSFEVILRGMRERAPFLRPPLPLPDREADLPLCISDRDPLVSEEDDRED